MELWAKILSCKFSGNDDFHAILGSFTRRKLRHGTDGFTSPPKEGVLRIFSPGLNPRTRVPEASTLTPRPPKPLEKLVKNSIIFAIKIILFFREGKIERCPI